MLTTLPGPVQGAVIPKIIHQTYHSRTLPQEFQQNVRKLQDINPGWEYRFYDDGDIREFIISSYGVKIWSRFDSISAYYGASRADLFRYLLMYKLGGVYLDIKSACLRPLDEVLLHDDRYILSKWRNQVYEVHEGWGLVDELAEIPRGEFQQWHIICVPGHPFLAAVIERVLRNIAAYRPWRDGVGQMGVLRLTGPVPYTLAIQPLLSAYPHRLVESEEELGLQYSVVDNFAHHHLFKHHYTQLSRSVVDLRGVRRPLAELYVFAREFKQRYLTRRRNPPPVSAEVRAAGREADRQDG